MWNFFERKRKLYIINVEQETWVTSDGMFLNHSIYTLVIKTDTREKIIEKESMLLKKYKDKASNSKKLFL